MSENTAHFFPNFGHPSNLYLPPPPTHTPTSTQHKEPKLNMAKRVINGSLFPESWEELDIIANGQ